VPESRKCLYANGWRVGKTDASGVVARRTSYRTTTTSSRSGPTSCRWNTHLPRSEIVIFHQIAVARLSSRSRIRDLRRACRDAGRQRVPLEFRELSMTHAGKVSRPHRSSRRILFRWRRVRSNSCDWMNALMGNAVDEQAAR
jgi:hypothetical protein